MLRDVGFGIDSTSQAQKRLAQEQPRLVAACNGKELSQPGFVDHLSDVPAGQPSRNSSSV